MAIASIVKCASWRVPSDSMLQQDVAQLLDRFKRHQRRALAEMISLVEAGAVLPPPDVPGRAAHLVGITGSAGAGKSTLVAASIAHLRDQSRSVAVLACDPNSPLTGGALLGDRIRVRFDAQDEQVYFRSLSTRGAQGGVSAAVGPASRWLQAFGFDVVLIETVGVGQDQVAVRELVETLVLLVTPSTGDEVQWEKAGLLEVADMVVVNKSDLPGAEHVRQQLTSALSLSDAGKRVPVLHVSACNGKGIPDLWQAIDRHHKST